jgi:hypothetical protein
MFINQSGLAVCVQDDLVEKALRDGCRPATEADMAWAAMDRSKFALPWVDGYTRGQLGNRPVMVVGGGREAEKPLEDMFRIHVNPRSNVPPSDMAICLDGIYFNTAKYRCWRAKYPSTPVYAPHGVHCYKGKPVRFGMPVSVIKGQDNNHMEIRTRDGIQKAHFTGIAAVLMAKFLSTGPTILVGFDLRAKDDAGNTYEKRQLASWKAAADLWDDVYLHPTCKGPLTEIMPVWSK